MEFSLERGIATLLFLVVFTILITVVYPFATTSTQRVDTHTSQTLATRDTTKNTAENNQEAIDNFDINSIPRAD